MKATEQNCGNCQHGVPCGQDGAATGMICVNQKLNGFSPADTERTKWAADCLRWRGRVLTGVHAHWCRDYDDLPVDETTPEWPCACGPCGAAQ